MRGGKKKIIDEKDRHTPALGHSVLIGAFPPVAAGRERQQAASKFNTRRRSCELRAAPERHAWAEIRASTHHKSTLPLLSTAYIYIYIHPPPPTLPSVCLRNFIIFSVTPRTKERKKHLAPLIQSDNDFQWTSFCLYSVAHTLRFSFAALPPPDFPNNLREFSRTHFLLPDVGLMEVGVGEGG